MGDGLNTPTNQPFSKYKSDAKTKFKVIILTVLKVAPIMKKEETKRELWRNALAMDIFTVKGCSSIL